ncbi:MAG: glycoside hydrolase/deacetylase [Bacilli bacterium]|nr:glycoside hydrolase/deacetylase [Bacilli bacterium]
MKRNRQASWPFFMIVTLVFLVACQENSSVPKVNESTSSPTVSAVPSVIETPLHSIQPSAPIQTTIPMSSLKTNLVAYNGVVEHIFFHPLIAYPELAFDQDAKSTFYNDWFVTVREFDQILESLYKNHFILIDIRSLYEEKTVDGQKTLARKPLMLPVGMKPLVISVDDLNYYDYMLVNGNVQKLVLDADGNVAAYSITPTGEKKVTRDNEIVPLLDDFVQAHPDFSFQGAKGLIALTGYKGILGYRTQNVTSATYAADKKEAVAVVNRLKETGWTFASHGYAHLDAAQVSYDKFVHDTKQWKAEVEPLIGSTPVYVYPFGSYVVTGSPKYKFLLGSGFQMICAIGPTPSLYVMKDSVIMDRRHIDGIALHTQRDKLLNLFDSNVIIDPIRPSKY